MGRQPGAPLFSTRKGWVPNRPLIRPSVRTGAPSPQGEGFGRGCFPFRTTTPTPPSPPSWGAGRYGHWFMGRRPGRKKERTPAGSPQPEKVGPGRKNLFLPGVLSSGFLPKKAVPLPGAGRATGRCAPRLRKSPDHPKGTRSPAVVGGGNHVAGSNLRRSRPDHPPAAIPPAGGAAPSHVSGSGSPRMVASGWKMAQKKSLSRARISRSSR